MNDLQAITANLIIAVYGNKTNLVPSGDLVNSCDVPYDYNESGYKAWLGYRLGFGLMVETPQRTSDNRYWHRLAAGYEVVINCWSETNSQDPGECHSFYAPDPNNLQEKYHINGTFFGNGHPTLAVHDRWLQTYNFPNVVSTAGHALKVTAIPARFAIVVEWRHSLPYDPSQPDPLAKGRTARGMSGTSGKGLGGQSQTLGLDTASTYLGAQKSQAGTARHRVITQVMYVQAFPMQVHPTAQ